ncbi:MAG: hypothetical protein MHPSP_003977, partial [Paramarteilia canceri]
VLDTLYDKFDIEEEYKIDEDIDLEEIFSLESINANDLPELDTSHRSLISKIRKMAKLLKRPRNRRVFKIHKV